MNKDIGILIMGFITLFIGLILIGSIADTTNESTTLFNYVNDTNTFTHAAGGPATGQLTFDRLVTVTDIQNDSGDGGDLTGELDTNINVSALGAISIVTEYENDSFNFSGAYGGDGYVQHGVSRTLVDLIPLFFAIALLLVGVGMVYVGLKGTGML